MIKIFLATLALQANPVNYEAFNPTIAYTRCMSSGLSARLPADADIEAGKRLALFEQALAECAGARASALANVDLMLSTMAASAGSPDPRISGMIMMGVWDKTFRELALDPKFHWQDLPPKEPGQ